MVGMEGKKVMVPIMVIVMVMSMVMVMAMVMADLEDLDHTMFL